MLSLSPKLTVAIASSHLKTSFEADVTIDASHLKDDTLRNALQLHREDLSRFFNASSVTLTLDSAEKVDVSDRTWMMRDDLSSAKLIISSPSAAKCPRCWKYTRQPQDSLCPRCQGVFESIAA